MQIPRRYVEEYNAALDELSRRTQEKLRDALSRIDYDADIADIRDAAIEAVQQACSASSTVAARLAAEFYDGLRSEFGIDDGFRAEVDAGYDPKETERAVRAYVQCIVDARRLR